MKKFLGVAAVAAVVVLGIGSGSALAADGMFGPFKIGAEAGYGTGHGGTSAYGGDGTFGLGPRVEYSIQELVDLPISIEASFNYYFVSCPSGVDCTLYEANVNGLYTLPIPIPETYQVYAGGGLNYVHKKVFAPNNVGGSAYSKRNEVGLNILAGVKFDIDLIFMPFVETKYELVGVNQLVISAGVLF